MKLHKIFIVLAVAVVGQNIAAGEYDPQAIQEGESKMGVVPFWVSKWISIGQDVRNPVTALPPQAYGSGVVDALIKQYNTTSSQTEKTKIRKAIASLSSSIKIKIENESGYVEYNPHDAAMIDDLDRLTIAKNKLDNFLKTTR